MKPHFHILFSALVSAGLFFLGKGPWFITLFFLSSVLIDIDHYFYYIFKKKNLNLIKAYKFFKKPKEGIYLFHTLEFLLIFAVLTLLFTFIWNFSFSFIFWPVFFGLLFHDLIDIIYGSFQKNKKYKRYWFYINYLRK